MYTVWYKNIEYIDTNNTKFQYSHLIAPILLITDIIDVIILFTSIKKNIIPRFKSCIEELIHINFYF